MWLAGCATETSDRRTICPPIVSYPAEFQARAANELDQLPDQSAVAVLVTDYSKMRSACRALTHTQGL